MTWLENEYRHRWAVSNRLKLSFETLRVFSIYKLMSDIYTPQLEANNKAIAQIEADILKKKEEMDEFGKHAFGRHIFDEHFLLCVPRGSKEFDNQIEVSKATAKVLTKEYFLYRTKVMSNEETRNEFQKVWNMVDELPERSRKEYNLFHNGVNKTLQASAMKLVEMELFIKSLKKQIKELQQHNIQLRKQLKLFAVSKPTTKRYIRKPL